MSAACSESSCGNCGRCTSADEADFYARGAPFFNHSPPHCVATCYFCGDEIPWDHVDERPPTVCDGCSEDDIPTVPRIRLGGAT